MVSGCIETTIIIKKLKDERRCYLNMKRLICKEDFWELFPDCKIGIVVCKGMENIYRDDETE